MTAVPNLCLTLLLLPAVVFAAEPPEPRFRHFTLDDKIQIGYGVAVADVDGDKRPDVLLADKRQIVWYQNPGTPPAGAASLAPPIWSKFVLAENLTEKDNVCLAAQDIDGDGKCEVAVGADWNPGDTEKSGAVFYLIAPEDRQQRWTPVKFPSVEPTTHRMRWMKLGVEGWGLVVVPLHGRGNKNGEGAPVKTLLYHPPALLNDPQGEWKSEVIDESMHMTHNFDIEGRSIYFAGREGILDVPRKGVATAPMITGNDGGNQQSAGVGEVRIGNFLLPTKVGAVTTRGMRFFAAVEPMHGNRLTLYRPIFDNANAEGPQQRRVLTDQLTEGHALATGDVLGTGGDQIVVGWRGTPGKAGSTTGVAVWAPLDRGGADWRATMIDPDGMACEDLQLADLDADGDLDIVASGRATKNVKIYWNETAASR